MQKKFYINRILSLFAIVVLVTACNEQSEQHGHDEHDDHEHEEEVGHHDEGENVHFSLSQFAALDMRVDSLRLRNMASVVQANGQLEVPPQNEATVTAVIGANISSINVI